MIDIKVLAPMIPESVINEPSPDALREVVSAVLAGARNEWMKHAETQLTGTRRDYMNGIQDVRMGTSKVHARGTISLVGAFPNMIENGTPVFDMHDTLLGPDVPVLEKGQKGKGKRKLANGNGYYRVVPLRHQTPGTAGVGGGPPMGSAYNNHPLVKDAAELGKQVHGLAMKLALTKKAGSKQKGKPSERRLAEGAGGAKKLMPHHSTDIYAGMIKQQKRTKGSAGTPTYTTFRVISDNVKHKWIHPGLPGVHIATTVSEYVDKHAAAAFAALVEPSD
jgi:hypothetical protein